MGLAEIVVLDYGRITGREILAAGSKQPKGNCYFHLGGGE